MAGNDRFAAIESDGAIDCNGSNCSIQSTPISHGHWRFGALGFFADKIYPMLMFHKPGGCPMLTFHQKRELQKLIIEQNKVLAGSPAPEVKILAERIKREAMVRLGIAPVIESERQK